MSAIEREPKILPGKDMPFAIRPLEEKDVAQSAEIERDAFPTLFPPTSFRRELNNRMANYLVAWRRGNVDGPDANAPPSEQPSASEGQNSRPLVSRLINNARSLLPKRHSAWEPGDQFLAGFLGTWYMVDEAHVVSVGVRARYRGSGIGELLLIAAIEHAMKRRAEVVTLEVRVSNHVAKNLYLKYGFEEKGRRNGYYTDNREDALIMTTEPINESPYPEEFRKLVQAHEVRWGCAERILR